MVLAASLDNRGSEEYSLCVIPVCFFGGLVHTLGRRAESRGNQGYRLHDVRSRFGSSFEASCTCFVLPVAPVAVAVCGSWAMSDSVHAVPFLPMRPSVLPPRPSMRLPAPPIPLRASRLRLKPIPLAKLQLAPTASSGPREPIAECAPCTEAAALAAERAPSSGPAAAGEAAVHAECASPAPKRRPTQPKGPPPAAEPQAKRRPTPPTGPPPAKRRPTAPKGPPPPAAAQNEKPEKPTPKVRRGPALLALLALTVQRLDPAAASELAACGSLRKPRQRQRFIGQMER